MKNKLEIIKKTVVISMLLSLALLAVPVGAQPQLITKVVTVKPSANGNEVEVTLPGFVNEVAPGVFSLGTAVDPSTGQVVEGLAIIHYKKGFSHKPQHPDKGGKPGGDSTNSCFSYLSRGAEWKVFGEGYVIDPSNPAELDEAGVRAIFADGIDQWEDATDGSIDGAKAVDVFGDEDTAKTVNRDTIGNLTGDNEVIFASISESNVIAVTYVWGIFGGPPFARELVEWNMVFNTNFDWSTVGDPNAMDLENIAVHELGHAFGMGHASDSTCSEETMYPTAAFGETLKRDLNAGDIAGIDGLY